MKIHRAANEALSRGIATEEGASNALAAMGDLRALASIRIAVELGVRVARSPPSCACGNQQSEF